MGKHDSGSEEELECTWCGTAIDPQQWHPIATAYSDGEVRIRPFCSQECRENWIEHTDPDTQPSEHRSITRPDEPPNSDMDDKS